MSAPASRAGKRSATRHSRPPSLHTWPSRLATLLSSWQARLHASWRAPAKQPRPVARARLCTLAFTLATTTTLAIPVAHAGQKSNCGTIVIPTGLGVAPSADITSMNPMLVTSIYNAEAASLLFEGLIWIGRDAKIDYSRSLASSITTPDNGTTYDVTLRPWHWSDGNARHHRGCRLHLEAHQPARHHLRQLRRRRHAGHRQNFHGHQPHPVRSRSEACREPHLVHL